MLKYERGVSYIELMLALLIVAFLVVGYTRIMTNSTKTMVNTSNKTNAVSWAVKTIESIRSKDFDSVPTGLWPTTDLSDRLGGPAVEQLGSLNVNFTRQVVVSSIYSGLKSIEVKISWTEAPDTEDLVITTMMSDK